MRNSTELIECCIQFGISARKLLKYLKKIHKMVEIVKRDAEVSLGYMKIFEREELIFNQGERQGIQQGIQRERTERTRQDIMKIMKNLQMTAEQAMNVLEIPEEERSRYLEIIQHG